MKNLLKYCGMVAACLVPAFSRAQDATNMIPKQSTAKDTSRQTDLIDIAKTLFHLTPKEPGTKKEKKVYFSFLPVRPELILAPRARLIFPPLHSPLTGTSATGLGSL
jgi:hypothetical protein